MVKLGIRDYRRPMVDPACRPNSFSVGTAVSALAGTKENNKPGMDGTVSQRRRTGFWGAAFWPGLFYKLLTRIYEPLFIREYR
jgi:hypothetical protein